MKRIRNIHDLEYEKLKLRVKQLELEKQMDRSWRRLKRNLSTDDLNKEKQTAQSNDHFKTRSTFLNTALSYGASFLSHKAGMLAGKKIENAAEQMLGRLAEKINLFVVKRKRT
jgi:hypothetical protein